MRLARPVSFAATALVGCCVLVLSVQAQYGDLVYRIPSSANTIVLLNVQAAESSPLGVKEGWRENHEKQFAAGLVLVPPQANRFVMAAQFDFPEFKPRWQVSLSDVRYEPSLPKVAARLNGTVDEIAGRSVAVLPGDLCVVKFGPRIAGTFTPAVRQEVARWLGAIDNNASGKLSAYMESSVKFAENGAPLIMAMDLKDVFSPAEIRPRLDAMAALKDQKVDLDQLAQTLSGIQGISLGVTLADRRFGKIKIDFAGDVAALAPVAKPLLLEVLGNHGAMIDEFETWTVKANGNQITLEGDLLASGTRRLLSLFDTPPDLQEQAAKASQTSPNDSQAQQKEMALASQLYFKQVVSLTDDLRLKRSSTEFVTWNQVGTWFEKYARKIDRMPTLNVDPELVKYGAWVATSMRDAESALKGIGPQSRLRQLEVPNYYNVQSYSVPIGVTWSGVYGWGGWSATEDLSARGQELAKVRTQEKIRGTMSANNTAQGIEQATGDMRRYLTEKYQMEF
jgi:hypothetical protein